MKRWFSICLVAAVGVSCGHHGRKAAGGAALPPPQPVFERHIRNAIDAGEGDYQLRVLRERVAADSNNLAARLDLARAYAKRGYPDIALEHCRLAAARFADSGEAALALAKALREMNLRQEAADALNTYLARHPASTPDLASWLGILRDELGQWKEGETAHRAALALSPRAEQLHNNLGYNLLMQGRRADAVQCFRNALIMNPNYTLARNNLGVALANQSDQALSELRRTSDPASAHSNLAAVLIEQGRYGEARKELDAALGYNKLHSAALNNLRLLSELDGKPATMPAGPVETRWNRWKAGFRSLFVGPLPGDSRKQAETAKGSL